MTRAKAFGSGLCAAGIGAASAASIALSGCQLDIDKIYEHESAPIDGEDAGPEPLPPHLIDLWAGQAVIDDACVRCAKSDCSAEEQSCRDDAECASLTTCVADSTDPDTQADCRSQHVDWLAESPYQRALGGPFYTCVFRDKCSEDCASHTDLSCRGAFSWEQTPDASVPVTFQFVNALDQRPAADVTAKVCRPEDVNCASPAGEPMMTDEEGKVALTLPTPLRSFNGFVELNGEGWYPTLVQLGWPVANPGVQYLPIVNKASVDANIALSGVAPDPERGQLQLRMFGCAGVGMRGVYFTASGADDQSRTWYAAQPLPSFTADGTNDLGSGGIINVAPGSTTIEARLRSDDSLVARTQVPVRAGYLTIVVLTPVPR